MSFAAQISAFGVKTKKQMDFFVFTVCTDIANGVILKTPVDSGRARSNWLASTDKPKSGVTTRLDPSGNAAMNAAKVVANNAAGRIFYLSNNLPYIRHLEYGLYGNPQGTANGPKTTGGFSKQAPAGMVRVTLNEVQRHYR